MLEYRCSRRVAASKSNIFIIKISKLCNCGHKTQLFFQQQSSPWSREDVRAGSQPAWMISKVCPIGQRAGAMRSSVMPSSCNGVIRNGSRFPEPNQRNRCLSLVSRSASSIRLNPLKSGSQIELNMVGAGAMQVCLNPLKSGSQIELREQNARGFPRWS